ncbi:MAG: hypothetical protein KAU60_00935, partial [Desulfobacterales bacterium]|nr:hypothetical protein [Desulfobacterales bacterium]
SHCHLIGLKFESDPPEYFGGGKRGRFAHPVCRSEDMWKRWNWQSGLPGTLRNWGYKPAGKLIFKNPIFGGGAELTYFLHNNAMYVAVQKIL